MIKEKILEMSVADLSEQITQMETELEEKNERIKELLIELGQRYEQIDMLIEMNDKIFNSAIEYRSQLAILELEKQNEQERKSV